jgi:hypothetical protein
MQHPGHHPQARMVAFSFSASFEILHFTRFPSKEAIFCNPLHSCQHSGSAHAHHCKSIYVSPCQQSSDLSALTGLPLHLKLENLQRTGSFKERGALNKLLTLSESEE